MQSADFEKLGAFYLGKTYDLAARARGDDLLLYDSKDLVTHAVCVGMTGSGKTGLCLGLLEEAAIDGIPSIVIDPKGDLSNLLLTFPDLAPADFRPWINEEDARKKGLEPDAFAAQQAQRWAQGIADWGQDAARVGRLKNAAEFRVYTPGSNAGLPVSVMKSFDCPPAAILEDSELMRERITSTATSLLGLLGIASDSINSRDHILLSTILHHAWTQGRNLDIPTLIHDIQQPPFTRLGVMELETVYPSGDRFGLAMALNNLVASPGFGSWMEGEPLDIGAMLHGPGGKPRVSIFSIAHLNDAERMFFVSLLLNQVLGWVRTQSGTSSLRAIVYMDEIAGYFPPVANPPSKQPLLTLMKQARAFGVGVVLATQNPVDLDYKGLSNAGTWFIGRLQTDRDKQRVLDGLEGAAANSAGGFDRASVDQLLSQLSTRVFLMNNIHEQGPAVFETRWCLSYLRGPLTRQQIKALMDPVRAGGASAAATRAAASAPVMASTAPIVPPPKPAAREPAPTSANNGARGAQRPILPPEIPQFFIPVRSPAAGVRYRAMVLGTSKIYYTDAKTNIDAELPACFLASIRPGPVTVDWDDAEQTDLTEQDVEPAPMAGVGFEPLPAEASKPKNYDAWKKTLAEKLYRSHKLELYRSAGFKASSRHNESERDFRLRLQQIAREQRDAAVDKLREKFAPKILTLQERIRKAEQALDVQKEQAKGAKFQTAISFGTAVLGALMGRKVASSGNVGRAATAARGVSRASKESSDVERAEENVEALRQQLAALETQVQQEIDAIAAASAQDADDLETVSLKPKKTNISVRACVLVWAPFTQEGARAWE